MTLTVGSLFSGIGGFDLGLERAGMQVMWQVENDPFCNKVLAKHWPDVQRFGDIKDCGTHNLEPVDLICGGWPCQPFSVAGKQRGKADDRYLWPEVIRIIEALRPTWFLGENVPGIVRMDLDQVLTDLETAGYATRTFNIPACSLGADHRRYRIWIVAYNLKSGTRMEEYRSCGQRGQTANTLQPAILLKTNGPISPERIGASCENVAHTFTKRRKRQKRSELPSVPSWEHQSSSRPDRGTPESDLDRITNGLPQRVDRIKCLGNAVYPRIPEFIGRQIMKYEEPVWK